MTDTTAKSIATTGTRVALTSYGARQLGTVTQAGTSIIWLRLDGTYHARWAHLASIETI